MFRLELKGIIQHSKKEH